MEDFKILTFKKKKINGIRLCDKSKPPRIFNIRLEVWMNNDLTDAASLNVHNAIKSDIKSILKKYNAKFEEIYKSPKK